MIQSTIDWSEVEARLIVRSLLIVSAVCAPGPAARAADLSAPSLPMLAADPPGASPWTGLYAGTQVFAIGGSHIKGLVGGGAYVGYDHEFANRVVFGIEASSGAARGPVGYGGFNGFNYAGTAVKVGYDMGRVMPYAFAGLDLAKPTFRGNGGFTGGGDGLNGLFSGSSRKLSSFTTVGAGVDYKLTDRITLGVAVGSVQSRGGYAPLGPTFP